MTLVILDGIIQSFKLTIFRITALASFKSWPYCPLHRCYRSTFLYFHAINGYKIPKTHLFWADIECWYFSAPFLWLKLLTFASGVLNSVLKDHKHDLNIANHAQTWWMLLDQRPTWYFHQFSRANIIALIIWLLFSEVQVRVWVHFWPEGRWMRILLYSIFLQLTTKPKESRKRSNNAAKYYPCW